MFETEAITKSLLRKAILQYRTLLDHPIFDQRNKQLLIELEKLIAEEKIQTIHTFLPIKRNREVDVTSLFSKWRDEGRKIVVSKTEFKSKTMSHFFLETDTQLKESAIGIPEPVKAEVADFSQVDLILVPLLACDKHQNRIGYGGGYYDRLLSETKAMKVGLSLSPPLDRIFQKEEWDIPLDHILTFK